MKELNYFDIAVGIAKKHNEAIIREKEQDADWKASEEAFVKAINETLDTFLMKHYGKDYDKELYSELHGEIFKVLKKHNAVPSLF
jgi:hypothetical protein